MRLARRVALGFAEALNAAGRCVRDFAASSGMAGLLRSAGNDEPNGFHGRPIRGLTWPLRALLAAALAVPLLLLAIAAGQNFRLVREQAEQRVVIETGQLHEHALNALQTYSLILAWIDDRIHGLDWDRIEHDEGLHRFLLELETLPQINAVSIIDASGSIRASGRPVSMPRADGSGREAFVIQRERDAGIFIGRDRADQPTHNSAFDISRRRSTADGSFDGVILVSARAEYFSDFFSTVSQDKHFSALLMRSDGAVLVRTPPLPGPLVFEPDTPIMQAIANAPERGLFWSRGRADGIARLFSYRRIGNYPLFVLLGAPRGSVFASWRANFVDYLLFAVPASLGLFCMTLFAVRQFQQQKVASWRWRTTAQRLKREMNRRTQAEADLYQAQKMEALGQLTGGVAHDFNNLLTVLQGCLEMLSNRQQNDRLQARVEMALATIERGEKLTRQLLAFARRQPLRVTRIDINDMLRRMSELLAQTVGSDVRLVSDLAPCLWPVDADSAQLELAVINLVINARDAMPVGGVLRLRTFNTMSPGQAADREPSEEGAFVGLEISDTGTGMPPEVLARAFEPFFTSKGPGKGTGLGLSIVYGFARQSGGSATIRSEVGRGTTVTILLPRSPEPNTTEDRTATDLPQGGSA